MPRARHTDPFIDGLYRHRRAAANAADTPGFRGIDGWRRLEEIENQLRDLDPSGDWQYEGDWRDGAGWQVRLPA